MSSIIAHANPETNLTISWQKGRIGGKHSVSKHLPNSGLIPLPTRFHPKLTHCPRPRKLRYCDRSRLSREKPQARRPSRHRTRCTMQTVRPIFTNFNPTTALTTDQAATTAAAAPTISAPIPFSPRHPLTTAHYPNTTSPKPTTAIHYPHT